MSGYWCENCDDTTVASYTDTDNGPRCYSCKNPIKECSHVIRCLKIELAEVNALRQLEFEQRNLNEKTPF